MILGTAVALPAFAQQTSEPLEEIVVTGIRGSLTSSMNLKRDAQGVVDGIVAEDIGKFPDTNLAESLQRISGVSIDRSDRRRLSASRFAASARTSTWCC